MVTIRPNPATAGSDYSTSSGSSTPDSLSPPVRISAFPPNSRNMGTANSNGSNGELGSTSTEPGRRSMLPPVPPPIPKFQGKSSNEDRPTTITTPPRMTRLPSLQQISDKYHSSSIQTSDSATVYTSGMMTPPSARINSSVMSPPGGLNQSPFVASPSSRLKLPASAMIRSLSGGGTKGNPPSPVERSRSNQLSASSSNQQAPLISGTSSSTQPASTWQSMLSDSMGIAPEPGDSPTDSAKPTQTMVRTPSATDAFIKGYKDIPSLAEIGRRMSVTRSRDSTIAAVASASDSQTAANEHMEDKSVSDDPSFARMEDTSEIKAPVIVVDGATESGGSVIVEQGSTSKKDQHPLQHSWTLFFDSKTYKPEPRVQDPNEPVLDDYEKSLLTVGKFDTVEGFARHMNNVRLPSLLARNSNYHLFKNGIRPMWEDPANADGGKWVLLIRSSPAILDSAWANLMMALVGDILDPADQVCGIVASTRPKVDRIQVWTRGRDDVEINAVGQRILESLELDPREMEAVSMEFQFNASNTAPPVGKYIQIPFGPSRTTISFPSQIAPTPSRMTHINSSPLTPSFTPTPMGLGINLIPPPPGLGSRRSSSPSNGGLGSQAFAGVMGNSKTLPGLGTTGTSLGGIGGLATRRASNHPVPQLSVQIGRQSGW